MFPLIIYIASICKYRSITNITLWTNCAGNASGVLLVKKKTANPYYGTVQALRHILHARHSKSFYFISD